MIKYPAAVSLLSPGDPQKGETTMLVKAKWNVKDGAGWHSAGEVFETNDELGDCVEVLIPEEPKEVAQEKAQETEPEKAEPAKPRTSRRKISK